MDVFDPREAAPEARAAFLAWLAVQRRFGLSRARGLPAAFRKVAQGAPVRDVAALARSHGVAPLAAGEAQALLRTLAQAGVRGVPLGSAFYPARLARLDDAPPLLFVRGNPGLLLARCVAMVGARAATPYGVRVARQVASDLARAGLVVVSGLALGVDAAAHQGALEAGGATLAFLACGPERIYPNAHRGLAGQVAAQGAVVSEFPVGAPPRSFHFPYRNRLISAISEAVVVVEARIRSGSLTTADHAARQGVDVWAVPGPVDRPTSQGPHRLLREGAAPLTSAADLLEQLGLAPPPRRKAARAKSQEGAAPDGANAPALLKPGAAAALPSTAAPQDGAAPSAAFAAAATSDDPTPVDSDSAVPPADALARGALQALREEPRDEEELSALLKAAPGAIAAALARLEIEGLACRGRDGRWALR